MRDSMIYRFRQLPTTIAVEVWDDATTLGLYVHGGMIDGVELPPGADTQAVEMAAAALAAAHGITRYTVTTV